MDDSSLHLNQFKGLRAISLAGTQVTDSNLIAIGKMDRLFDIDVSHTAFSDLALKHLSRKLDLERLSLAGTQVTTEGNNEVMTGRRISALDIVTQWSSPSTIVCQVKLVERVDERLRGWR